MVPTPPKKENVTRRVRRAIHPYLAGAKSVAWMLRGIRGQEAYALYLLATEFPNYRDTPRDRELRDALERKLE